MLENLKCRDPIQNLPNFLKIMEQWGAADDAQAHPHIVAVMAQLLPAVRGVLGR
jgi:hypothetical protein